MSNEAIVTATEFHGRQVCPTCQGSIRPGDLIHLCQVCGAASHERCWRQEQGCQSYFCRKSARAGGHRGPAISITREDTDGLRKDQLLPANTAYPQDREGRYPKKFSKLAIIAIVLALVSAGTLGFVSLILAAIALGSIANNSTLRGKWVAISAILLSILLMFGWAAALWLAPAEWNVHRTRHVEFQDSPEALANVPEPSRGSMRANVLVRVTGRGIMGHMMMGSGIIVALAPERVLILTNRHVVEPGFREGRTGPVKQANIEVFFCGGERVEASVSWTHPDGFDLVLLECHPKDIETPGAARIKLPTRATIGEEVYAIGNPMELGWTYTKGVISSIREKVVNGKALRVYQTQTPINAGNSGGGLYDSNGNLLGINTWTRSKGTAEGLSFAIAVDHAAEVLDPLMAPEGEEDGRSSDPNGSDEGSAP